MVSFDNWEEERDDALTACDCGYVIYPGELLCGQCLAYGGPQ